MKKRTIQRRAEVAYARCPHTSFESNGRVSYERGYLAGYRAAQRDAKRRGKKT